MLLTLGGGRNLAFHKRARSLTFVADDGLSVVNLAVELSHDTVSLRVTDVTFRRDLDTEEWNVPAGLCDLVPLYKLLSQSGFYPRSHPTHLHWMAVVGCAAALGGDWEALRRSVAVSRLSGHAAPEARAIASGSSRSAGGLVADVLFHALLSAAGVWPRDPDFAAWLGDLRLLADSVWSLLPDRRLLAGLCIDIPDTKCLLVLAEMAHELDAANRTGAESPGVLRDRLASFPLEEKVVEFWFGNEPGAHWSLELEDTEHTPRLEISRNRFQDAVDYPEMMRAVSTHRAEAGLHIPFQAGDYLQCLREQRLSLHPDAATAIVTAAATLGSPVAAVMHAQASLPDAPAEGDAFARSVAHCEYLFARRSDLAAQAGGGLVVFRGDEARCWITYFAQKPGLRGYGSKLIALLFARARELGFPEIHVWTDAANREAVEFYRSVGFRPSDALPPDAPAGADVACLVRSLDDFFSWPWRMLA